MRSKNLFILMILAVVCLQGCSSTKVTRVDIEDQIDLSGYWNDSDARMVSQDMVAECLGQNWIQLFIERNNRRPVVIIGQVANNTHEHINPEIFTKHLEREVLNSGLATFVASAEERTQVRLERDDQQKGLTDPETVKRIGKEKGADVMLIGSMNTVKDEVKGKFVILYQVNLEMIDIQTNEKYWIGQTEVKKMVKHSKLSL